jgi:hypothetical protein
MNMANAPETPHIVEDVSSDLWNYYGAMLPIRERIRSMIMVEKIREASQTWVLPVTLRRKVIIKRHQKCCQTASTTTPMKNFWNGGQPPSWSYHALYHFWHWEAVKANYMRCDVYEVRPHDVIVSKRAKLRVDERATVQSKADAQNRKRRRTEEWVYRAVRGWPGSLGKLTRSWINLHTSQHIVYPSRFKFTHHAWQWREGQAEGQYPYTIIL